MNKKEFEKLRTADWLYSEACKNLAAFGGDELLKKFYTNVLRCAQDRLIQIKALELQEAY